jgi:hypothetical protein
MGFETGIKGTIVSSNVNNFRITSNIAYVILSVQENTDLHRSPVAKDITVNQNLKDPSLSNSHQRHTAMNAQDDM